MFYEDKNERFTVSFFSIPPPGHTQHDGNVRIWLARLVKRTQWSWDSKSITTPTAIEFNGLSGMMEELFWKCRLVNGQ
jgi:hypothetical protein